MKYILRLYTSGKTGKSKRAIANLQALTKHLKDKIDIEIIDILKEPEVALQENIIAIPTLDKKSPPPFQRFIGDLSDTEKIGFALKLFVTTENNIVREDIGHEEV